MTISFTNVNKTLREKTKKTKILEEATAQVPSDKITGILAPPGSGKTTVANLMTGRLRPDSGRVVRSSMMSFPVASGGIFNGLLTPRENLAFLCRVFGFDPVPIIRFIANFTEIGPAMDKHFKSLNRDERTRLLFTACYAIPFETYIVDETMIGGRGAFRAQCEDLVAERMQTAGFVIFTSSARLLKRHCTDVFVLDDYKIKDMASADEAEWFLGADRLRDGNGDLEQVAEDVEEYNSL